MTREEREEVIEYLKRADITVGKKVKTRTAEILETAIKALEQEPCEDAVSREAVLGCLYTTLESYYIRRRINDLPPVYPEPKTEDWVPVSDKLPKTSGVYRVTRCYSNNIITNYLIDACYFDGSDTWYDDNRINHGRSYVDNVIAWQENPEPYKPQESEG